jgi:hypothetical protein
MSRLALTGLLIAAAAAAPAAALPSVQPRPCRAKMATGVIPPWARGGFSEPRPRMPHVVGRSGEIAALVFGYPLLAPPSPTRSNKILWVARVPVQGRSVLRIEAQRMAGARRVGQTVHRVVEGGPGPSIVDLPRAGCWRLTLSWSHNRDSLDLAYRRGK